MHSLVTLILTFSLREKELESKRVKSRERTPPLPEGEGWGEGPFVIAQKTSRHR